MTLNNPYALIWATAGIPLALLYLRCIRPPVRRVATGHFWEETLGAGGISDATVRRRHVVSLGLLLAILGLLVLAMADPTERPPLRAVLVIDHSVAMNASVDDESNTGFSQAKQTVARWISEMGERDTFGLVAGGDPSWIACGPTNRRTDLAAALEKITPNARSGGLAEATEAARRLLREGGPGGWVVVLTDGRDVAGLADAQGVALIVFDSSGARRLATGALSSSAAPWWPTLVALAMLAVMAEWILFQRRWTT